MLHSRSTYKGNIRFKGYYTQHVLLHQLHYFPRLVSYQRFVELMPGALPRCVCC
jgi:hypothetical protein